MTFTEKLKYHFSHNRPSVHVHFDAFTYLDYNYIDDGVYIGTNQCCTAGLSELLKREQITADISLEEDRLDAPFGVSSYTWIPTRDDNPPTFRQLLFGIETIENLVRMKQKVYLHCKHGHGRSCTYFAGYLMKKNHISADEAFAQIKRQRPSASMHESQKLFLQSFGEYLVSSGKSNPDLL